MMNDSSGVRQVDAGLCAACAHVKLITSSRAATFYMCRLSASDPRFPRYPRLPVIACDGYRPAEVTRRDP
jgi:hypothetical protein